MDQVTKKQYEAPSLTSYGGVDAVTGNQNSKGSDVPLGPNDTISDNYYSVGK